jgi:hypothetical protein
VTELQTLLAVTSVLLIAGILIGVFRRGLQRVCYTFVAYLGAVLLGDLLLLVAAETFYNWNFWTFKETVYAVLKLAIGCELAMLTFQVFPGARRRAWQLAAAMSALLAAAIAISPLPDDAIVAPLQFQARLSNGTALLLASLLTLVLWYRIPLHWLHRAILRALLVYLLVITVVFQAFQSLGSDFRSWIGNAASFSYLALLTYWLWVVWRPEPSPEGSPELLARLQPWRHKL